jgi:hypothetical protein
VTSIEKVLTGGGNRERVHLAQNFGKWRPLDLALTMCRVLLRAVLAVIVGSTRWQRVARLGIGTQTSALLPWRRARSWHGVGGAGSVQRENKPSRPWGCGAWSLRGLISDESQAAGYELKPI